MSQCEECIFKGMSPREAITTNHHHRVCGYHANPYRLTLVEEDDQYRGGGGQYDVIDGFDPARAFRGAKPGWVFKWGGHGLGYYREAAAGQPQQPQFAAQQYGQYGGGGGHYGQPQQPQFAQPASQEVRPIRVQSEVIRCIQRPSAGLTGPQWHSVALRGYPRPSKAIRDHHWQSLAISGHQ